MDPLVAVVALIGIVIVVGSLLSGVVERSGVPLVVAFLLLGAALGPAALGVADVRLESPVLRALATLALALVLFSDAVTVDVREIRTQWPLVWRVLGPGTLLPAALVALVAWLLLGVTIPGAIVLGGALASTDPVLLRGILRSPALPATGRVALRLESGLNDALLVPVVIIAMLFVRPGGAVTGASLGRSALGLFILGPALGAVIGWVGIGVLARVRRRVGVRRDYESLYALGLAFSAFAAAEAVEGSGFLAAFTAGLVIAARDIELCDCFLEYGQATSEMLLLLTFVAFGTGLIWTGLRLLDGRTLLFAIAALAARPLVLLPVLARAGVPRRERRLIALFGPRALSSLLLVLLPVFAGLPGSERLFTLVTLVVLLSLVVHGAIIAGFLRAHAPERRPAAVPPRVDATSEPAAAAPAEPERISVAEVRSLLEAGAPVIIADARTERSRGADDAQARDAVRLPPEDAVRAAADLRLAHHATLVVYCA